MCKPCQNVVLIGMPGCGKSTIGEKLAEELNVRFCDVDKYITEVTGCSILEIFESGEEKFREIESKCVEEISKIYPQVIATGGGVVKNSENINELKKRGKIIFINRPIEKICTDVDILSRPLLINRRESLYKLYDERYDLYKKFCDYEVINDSSINEVKDKIIAYLKQF